MVTPGMEAVLATDPRANVQEPAVRQAWYDLASEGFDELCNIGYTHGDFGHVANVFKHKREGMNQFFAGRANNNRIEVSNKDTMLPSFIHLFHLGGP